MCFDEKIPLSGVLRHSEAFCARLSQVLCVLRRSRGFVDLVIL